MENITIGINQRIPIHILELALCAALQDEASPEYFSELAATEYKGENRIKKSVSVINKLTVRNPIFGYLHIFIHLYHSFLYIYITFFHFCHMILQ